MTVVPKIMACLASFERIQAYLIDGIIEDPRETIGKSPHTSFPDSAIQVRNVTYDTKNNSTPVLKNVDLDVKHGSVIICSGSVGSGKTFLINIILGEVPFTSGSVMISSNQIGFCSQSSWLPNGSIKAVICAFDENIDEVRYTEVVRACCLDVDLQNLSDGENTIVGSCGMNLSGGQKQRVVSTCVERVFDYTSDKRIGTSTAAIRTYRHGDTG